MLYEDMMWSVSSSGAIEEYSAEGCADRCRVTPGCVGSMFDDLSNCDLVMTEEAVLLHGMFYKSSKCFPEKQSDSTTLFPKDFS